MTVTDITTLILSIFFLLRGASRGFMNSLIVPFSIIVATIISIIYYQVTEDMIASLLIGLIGPLVLSLLLKFLLKAWSKATNTDIKPDFLSRLGGSILTIIWGWVFIIFTLILLTVLPPWGETFKAIHNDVKKSNSYLIARHFEEILFAASKPNVPPVANETSNNDAKSLAEDPRFQKILRDPDIQKEIDAHDIVKLMRNPKMIDLVKQMMSDPATMKKVLTLYKNQAQPQANKNE
jgi:uncharacterized membrane protein